MLLYRLFSAESFFSILSFPWKSEEPEKIAESFVKGQFIYMESFYQH